jgi:hypothetical protein
MAGHRRKFSAISSFRALQCQCPELVSVRRAVYPRRVAAFVVGVSGAANETGGKMSVWFVDGDRIGRSIDLLPVSLLQLASGVAVPVHAGAYFLKAQTRLDGPSKIYRRIADSGFGVQLHFCPECGTTVFWETDKYPDRIGIAAGCFADPTFPTPTLSM